MKQSLPVTGAWLQGDPPGRRNFCRLFDGCPFTLESEDSLANVIVAFETWGELAVDASNAILVLHPLTCDSHAAGPAVEGHRLPGWWHNLIGPSCAIDTDRYFVVCPNVLGGCQGSTGPASPAPDGRPYGSRFPFITIRDQIHVEAALADQLGIECWYAVVGGSLGGMRALEWAVEFPHRVDRLVVIAAGAQSTAEQIAWSTIQTRIIESDPGWLGGDYYDLPFGQGPARGMAIARAIGMMTYRTEAQLEKRFGIFHNSSESNLSLAQHSVVSYLSHHGERLAYVFDANSYRVLNSAMNHHDVGRHRGGVANALARIKARTTIVGIDSDRLYPIHLQQQLVSLITTTNQLAVIRSLCGHDAFLTETTALARILVNALTESVDPV